MKSMVSLIRVLVLLMVLVLGTACGERKLASKQKVKTNQRLVTGPIEITDTFDTMPEFELYIEEKNPFISYIESKLDEEGNAIDLTAAQESLVAAYDSRTNKNIEIKAKFKTVGQVQFNDPSVYTLLNGRIEVDGNKLLISIDFGNGDVIKITESHNPLTEVRTFTRWQIGTYGIPLNTSLLGVHFVTENSYFEVLGSVRDISTTSSGASVKVYLTGGTAFPIVLKSNPEPSSDFINLNLCTYMSESLSEQTCN